MIEEQPVNYLEQIPTPLKARIGSKLSLKDQIVWSAAEKSPYQPDELKLFDPLAALALEQKGTLLHLTRVARHEMSPFAPRSLKALNDLRKPDTEHRINEHLTTLPDNDPGRKLVADLLAKYKNVRHFREIDLRDIDKLDAVEKISLCQHPEAEDIYLADFAAKAVRREERHMLEQHPKAGPLTKCALERTASRPELVAEVVVENIQHMKHLSAEMFRMVGTTSTMVAQQTLRNVYRMFGGS